MSAAWLRDQFEILEFSAFIFLLYLKRYGPSYLDIAVLHNKINKKEEGVCLKLFSFSSVWFPEFVKIDIFAFRLQKGNSLGVPFKCHVIYVVKLTTKSSRFYVPDAWVAWILKKDFQLGGGFLSCSWQTPGLATNSIFSGSFLWKIIELPGGQINDPSPGKHYSLPFLSVTPSSPSRNLEGLFELTQRPSRALASPRALLLELQRNKDAVRCALLGAGVPGHRQKQLTQSLIVRLL